MTHQFITVSHVSLEDMNGAPTKEFVATIGLNRPKTANAISGEFFTELTESLKQLGMTAACRAVVVYGVGKHFSAGADLQWMKSAAELGFEDNQRASGKIRDLYETLAKLPIPSLCAVQGAAYGGAVGLAAAADYTVASLDAKFCLSEVRVGLLPAVIFPYLARKMRLGDLHRFGLSGAVFTGEQALAAGLAQVVCPLESLQETVTAELNNLLQASPEAQRSLKTLSMQIIAQSLQQSSDTVTAIVKARASVSGKEGIQSFFNQTKPSWQRKIPANALLFKAPDL